MKLLHLISWQYTRKHLLRTVLTMVGIVLGVAVFVGMHTANQSVLEAFHKTVDRIAGATELQISAGEPGFAEEVLDRIQAIAEVRVAVPVIEATINPKLKTPGNILVLAVDMTGDRSLRDYDLENADDSAIDDPLVFLAQPDSLMVTREFAAANDLKLNSKVEMETMEGPKTFTIRGVMKSGGLTSAFGGNLAIMDVYAAQKVFGRGRRFDRVDIALKEGVGVDQGRRILEKTLGLGFQVETPAARGKQFESLSSVYGMMANLTSLFALFIGMFIIYNSFAIAVTQRRKEIGILRALGATRGQIQALFFGESAILGLVGSVIGVLFGVLIARGMAKGLGDFLGEVYGVAQRAEELSANPKLLLFSLVLGLATSLIAAWIPARSAARVDPVQALQKGRYQQLTDGEHRVRAALAIIFGALAIGLAAIGGGPVFFYGGYLSAVFAALMVTPWAAVWLARLLRPVLRWVRPVEGALAVDSLIQSPRRTSGTVAALMLSLALVISLGGLTRASYESMNEWMRVGLNPDLFLSPSQSITDRSYRFPAQVVEDVAAIDGVRVAQGVRTVRVNFRNEPIMIVTGDIAGIAREAMLPVVAGKHEEMYPKAAAGEGVVVSDNLANLQKLKMGDMIELDSPNGQVRLPIVGIVLDYSDQKGTILLDWKVYLEKWRDPTFNVIRIYLKPGADAVKVRQALIERFAGGLKVFVFTNKDLRDYILKITNQWFGLTYIQLGVAVLVAVLGIVNTLTVSITDRRRELGVLQAVGALRNQIRRTVWLEAAAIGLVGLGLGLGLGAIALYYSLEFTARDFAGLRLEYKYPWSMALYLLPVILGAAFLAALGPAESAVRGSLVEALEYE